MVALVKHLHCPGVNLPARARNSFSCSEGQTDGGRWMTQEKSTNKQIQQPVNTAPTSKARIRPPTAAQPPPPRVTPFSTHTWHIYVRWTRGERSPFPPTQTQRGERRRRRTDPGQEVMAHFQLLDLLFLLFISVRKEQLIGRADARQRQEVLDVLFDLQVFLLRAPPPAQRHTCGAGRGERGLGLGQRGCSYLAV